MDSLSEEATVTLPIGQVVSKEEYRLACSGSMGDATVGRTSVVTDQLMTIDKANFSVEATIVTEGIAAKSGNKREVSYPAAFFLTVDSRTDQVTAVRMYAQNIALLAARGYSMVPDDKNAPVIRPA